MPRIVIKKNNLFQVKIKLLIKNSQNPPLVLPSILLICSLMNVTHIGSEFWTNYASKTHKSVVVSSHRVIA